MTLRGKLALSFVLFAAVPLAATFLPVSRALSRALEAEHGARLEAATRAVEGELARLGDGARAAVAGLAASDEALALAREHARGDAPAEEAVRARAWREARGLDVLSVAEPDGRVLSSGHLPGRAGDVDPDLAGLLSSSPPGAAVPRIVLRAGPDGVERVLALVAWAPLPGDGPPLRIAGGMAVGREQAERLAALTGGAISVRSGDGSILAEAAAPGAEIGAPWRWLAGALGGLSGPAREIPLGPSGEPVARIEVATASEGLARARAMVLAAFALALAAGAAAAAILGRLLASRVTRPLEALRDGAARVAAGDLGSRVGVRAAGEVGDLVRAFDSMTSDLAASRSRLAQAERIAAWREVARRLAHEIKNPLTPIAMSVETLREARERARPDFPEIFEEATRAISEEVRRLKRIVDEFGRFARLPPPVLEPESPAGIAQDALALHAGPPPGISVLRELEPGLPDVLADRDQIVQVLRNVIGNALDAMPSGGTLRVAVRRAEGAVAFSVEDTGAGVAPGDLARIFEPYFTTKEGGTGLGLAIARRIAEEHGGTLEASSAPGRGATFTLTLPLAAGPGLTSPASP